MDNLIFYKDTTIGREIAFVLGIPFEFIDEIDKDKLKNKCLFLENRDIAVRNNLVEYDDYISFEELYDYLDHFNREWEIGFRTNQPITHDLDEINKIPSSLLFLSEMLVKVLYSPSKDIECKELTTKYNIDCYGNLWGCCPGWILKPHGNFLYDKYVDDNYYARIIKLSQMNKTFCFCDLNKCKYYGSKEINRPKIDFNIPKYPEQITVSIDKTCNLRCNSCRRCFYIPTKEEKELTDAITNSLIDSNILNFTDVVLAGQGEVFYSKNYEKILNSITKTDIIKIFTNGTLFTEEKWKLIYPKFKTICVSISIDASSKDTYIKLRHGDFDALLKNLDFISKLKKEGKIDQLWFNFVVQKDNMHEMKDFVELAEKHYVDKLQFTKLNNWGTMSDEEYNDKCLIIDNYLDYNLYQILKDPIFKKSFVDIDYFKEYMKNSKEHYNK